MRLRVRSRIPLSFLAPVVFLAGLTASMSDAPSAGAATPNQWVTANLPNEPGWSASQLNGVSCLSATSCVAVGQYEVQGIAQFFPLVATLQDSTWSFTPLPLPAGLPAGFYEQLNSVSCVSTSSCVAVGSGYAEILSGGTWQPVTTLGSGPFPSLSSVSCTSAKFCVAVGSDDPNTGHPVIATLSGSTWSTLTPSTPVNAGVSCPTPLYCLAVGNGVPSGGGLQAEVYDGSSWSTTTLPIPSGVTTDQNELGGGPMLNSVSCWAASECLIGGSYNAGIVPILDSFYIGRGGFADVLNGSTATSTIVLGTGTISNASCTSANSCAVVTGGATNVATYVNGSWAAAAGVSTAIAISCTSPTCVAVGSGGPNSNNVSIYSHPVSPSFVGLAATADNGGYWLANQAGGVWNYGNATYAGSLGDVTLNQPVVGIATTPSGGGYWEDATDGGVFSFGDAPFYGSTGGLKLNQPMVGMAALPNGTGYWLVAADGGIFAFGAAQFYGSMGGKPLNKPIVGMASTPDGGGYWLVASDGGVFSFGDAVFWGSTGGKPLNKPVVGMAADPKTGGYWEVAADGGIFSFNAPFYGSTGSITLNQPITAMEPSPTGLGYRFIARDGGVFDFGDSSFFGSPA